ncbi:plastocyanin/azurin family copper-binding protein [Salinisphaera orenii]|uniref:plastocyanin/azurin family copper-binding protein n=1 Tax=Salinisphaera orenii TaxID=856731 RepID=UPI0013A61C31
MRQIAIGILALTLIALPSSGFAASQRDDMHHMSGQSCCGQHHMQHGGQSMHHGSMGHGRGAMRGNHMNKADHPAEARHRNQATDEKAKNHASNTAEQRTIKVVAKNNLRFSKEHITAAPGETITIELVNNSRLPASAMSHNWILLQQSIDAGAFNSAAQSAGGPDYYPTRRADDVIAHTRMISGGQSDTITFTAPDKTGDYPYICTFPGHFRSGMKGTLTVKSKD